MFSPTLVRFLPFEADQNEETLSLCYNPQEY